ncbi:hypothetical protein FRB90_000167 [Tulasnella sp. 427]|nr:hypothetical protein FRB90_000167 [Tulasnella sp. 427]
MDDRTPGATTNEAGAPGPNPTGAGTSGNKVYPPYQNFENMNLDEQAASFAAAAKNASSNGTYGTGWTPGFGGLGAPTPSNFPVLSAGGKERAINELKDFWAAFISEPFSAGGSGAINNSNNSTGSGHSLQKQLSMPSLKTPMPLSSERTSMMDLNHPTPRTLYPSSGHQSILGMMFKPEPSSLSSSRPPNNNSSIKLDNPSEAASVQPPAPVIGDQEAENLRSYQEACLRRETPMLRLQHRPKSRIVKSSSLSPQFGGDNKKLPGVDGMVGGESAVGTSAPLKVDGSGGPASKGISASLPVFAEPFPPDSKEARDWHHYRAQAAAATDLHQATATAAASASSGRPTYKRLPSTTLGPESSKKARDDGDVDVSGSSDAYHISYPQPGYNNGTGGAHGAWMRQRSMSSPSSMRPHFDWQSFGSQRA